MKINRSHTLLTTALVGAGALALSQSLFAQDQGKLARGTLAKDPPAKCCFTNSAYTGVCEVTPASDETCKTILDYLNKPNSTGRSYCSGTQIRGGWAHVSCAAKPSPGSSTRDGARPAGRSRS